VINKTKTFHTITVLFYFYDGPVLNDANVAPTSEMRTVTRLVLLMPDNRRVGG